MPPRKYKSKSSKRPMRRRNYRRRKPTVLVNRALHPFPQRFITKMKYSEAFTLQLANGYTQVMNLNSLFDPNRSGIGHQPHGFDQLTPIYNRYRVISCSFVINAYSGSNPIRYGVLPCNDATLISGMSELCENPRARFRVQFPGGSTTTITGKVYLPSLVGRSKAEYMADDRYQALMGGSPAELALLYITGQTLADGASDITLTVTLEYTAELFDTNPVDQS